MLSTIHDFPDLKKSVKKISLVFVAPFKKAENHIKIIYLFKLRSGAKYTEAEHQQALMGLKRENR